MDDSLMFDYFAEKGVMRIFVALLNSTTVTASSSFFGSASLGHRQIMIQLLQTMSLLLLNVKRQTSLYFLLSNNAINQLINNNNNLDFSDEEILSYYVSLMKSISLRLSEETIHFFINDKTPNYFPLFSQSIRFFDHHDRMVRIAVRTVTLAIFKLYNRSEILQRFLNDNVGPYFSLLACQLRDLWLLMDRTTDEGTLRTVTDEMIDQLEYIAEIDRLALPAISNLLIEKLQLYALDGVLVKGLLQIVDGSDSPRIEDDEITTDSGDNKTSKILSLKLSVFVLIQLLEIVSPSVSEPLISQFLKSQESKSRIESELKSIGPAFNAILLLLSKLMALAGAREPFKENLIEFGMYPPKSVEVMILVAQSLSRSIEVMSLRSCQLAIKLVDDFLKDDHVSPDFKRPVRLTLIDSFRNASLRITQLIGDTLLRSSQNSNEMNYAIIDDFEYVLESSIDASYMGTIRVSSEDVGLIIPTSAEWQSAEQTVIASRDRLRVFFLFLAFVKRIEDDSFSLKSLRSDLFEPTIGSSGIWFDAEEINSPPTPPAELIEAESLATDRKTLAAGPLPEDILENDLVDLGKRDRIFCYYNRSSRYLVFDKTRLILVSPDLTRPGFATVKLVLPLRLFSSIEVKKDDQRSLVLTRANQSETEELTFDDTKRCHLALMHLETKRIDIRKNVYRRIESALRSLIHHP